jgi:hypothetical protein
MMSFLLRSSSTELQLKYGTELRKGSAPAAAGRRRGRHADPPAEAPLQRWLGRCRNGPGTVTTGPFAYSSPDQICV